MSLYVSKFITVVKMFVSVCEQCQQVQHGGEDVCLCVSSASKFSTVVKMFVSVCEQCQQV